MENFTSNYVKVPHKVQENENFFFWHFSWPIRPHTRNIKIKTTQNPKPRTQKQERPDFIPKENEIRY